MPNFINFGDFGQPASKSSLNAVSFTESVQHATRVVDNAKLVLADEQRENFINNI